MADVIANTDGIHLKSENRTEFSRSFASWAADLRAVRTEAFCDQVVALRRVNTQFKTLDIAPITALAAAEIKAEETRLWPLWRELDMTERPRTALDAMILIRELWTAEGGRLALSPAAPLLTALEEGIAQLPVCVALADLQAPEEGKTPTADLPDTMAAWLDRDEALNAEATRLADVAMADAKEAGLSVTEAEDEVLRIFAPKSHAHMATLKGQRIDTPQTAYRALAWGEGDGGENTDFMREAVMDYLSRLEEAGAGLA